MVQLGQALETDHIWEARNLHLVISMELELTTVLLEVVDFPILKHLKCREVMECSRFPNTWEGLEYKVE